MRKEVSWVLWLLVAAGALVACSRTVPGSSESTEVTAPPAAATLTLASPVHHLDTLAREPMLVVHPSGVLFVSGYGSQITLTRGVLRRSQWYPTSPPSLWKSSDGGESWQRVDVGTTADGAAGNSDVDLAVAADGTLYFISMGFDRAAGEGTHVAIGVSHDVGGSWSWTYLSQDRFDDRPWVEVAPDGTAHAIWNDGDGVSYSVSVDGGRSWSERPKIHQQGGSSHLAIGPSGEVAVRVTPMSASGNRFDEGLELIVVSTDGGATWQQHSPPGDREWDPTFSDPNGVPRWVEPIAWDAAGALYCLWSEGRELMLGRSIDRGETWQSWEVARDDEIAYFPYLVARGNGELAATWFSGRGEALTAHVALLQTPTVADGELNVRRSEPFQIEAWSETGAVRDAGGEYVPVAFLPSGGLAVVTPVQDAQGDRWGFSWWRIESE